MNRFRAPGLFPAVFFVLVFSASFTLPAFAQSAAAASTSAVSSRIYEASKETTTGGTISAVVQKPKAGLPLGLHLMVETPQGQMDVQLGPYYARIAAQKGLQPGATIQVTGETFHYAAGDVFLARTVTVNGQTLTIRNQYGFPVRPAPAGVRTVRGMQKTGGQ